MQLAENERARKHKRQSDFAAMMGAGGAAGSAGRLR